MYFIDTSAAVKLVAKESESSAMTTWARRHDGQIVACDLLRTELVRAVRRVDVSLMGQAVAVLDSLFVVTLTTQTYAHAAELEPRSMSSLDALHLACALGLGDSIDGLVTYDDRWATAARDYGLTVVTPRR